MPGPHQMADHQLYDERQHQKGGYLLHQATINLRLALYQQGIDPVAPETYPETVSAPKLSMALGVFMVFEGWLCPVMNIAFLP